MRSRRSSSGWLLDDTKAYGRRVTSKAPSAHVEGGSGHSEASPTAILQDTHRVEGEFLELPLYGVLRSWHSPGPLPKGIRRMTPRCLLGRSHGSSPKNRGQRHYRGFSGVIPGLRRRAPPGIRGARPAPPACSINPQDRQERLQVRVLPAHGDHLRIAAKIRVSGRGSGAASVQPAQCKPTED